MTNFSLCFVAVSTNFVARSPYGRVVTRGLESPEFGLGVVGPAGLFPEGVELLLFPFSVELLLVPGSFLFELLSLEFEFEF